MFFLVFCFCIVSFLCQSQKHWSCNMSTTITVLCLFEIILTQTKDCDYYNNASYSLSNSQVILDSVKIPNGSFQIEFDLNLNQYDLLWYRHIDIICIDSLPILSLMEGFYGRTISVSGFQITNANTLLRVNESHRIYLSYSEASHHDGYIQNVVKIDHFTAYYLPEDLHSLSSNIPHNLYGICPDSEGLLNGSISNICINTYINTEHVRIFEGDLECGDTLHNELVTDFDVDYYYLELSHHRTVLFDSCHASFPSLLTLYNLQYVEIMDVSTESFIYDESCFGGRLIVPSMRPGRYLLRVSALGNDSDWAFIDTDYQDIHDYGSYYLKIVCVVDNINTSEANNLNKHRKNTNFLLSGGTTLTWYNAERQCELLYGTTLATITTDIALMEAVQVINRTLGNYVLLDIYGYSSILIWIGLHSSLDISNKSDWEWIDGTSCDYIKSGDCSDDLHWDNDQFHPRKKLNATHDFGVALLIQQLENTTILPTFVALQVHPANAYFGSLYERYPLSLCNAPDSKYSLRTCTDDDCWHTIYKFNSTIMENDFILSPWKKSFSTPFRPAIAYRHPVLFLVGDQQIHYAKMNVFNNDDLLWHHITYSATWINPYFEITPLYAQYEQHLYVYGIQELFGGGYNGAILEIDLNIAAMLLSEQIQVIPMNIKETYPLASKCMVSGYDSIYLVRSTQIIVYSKDTKQITSLKFDNFRVNDWATGGDFIMEPISCVMSNDEQFIYVFSLSFNEDTAEDQFMYSVYDIRSRNVVYKNYAISTSCASVNTDTGVSIVMGKNDKVYVQDCNAAGWKTSVYDINTNGSFVGSIDIDVLIKSNMPYYRLSQLTAIGDNALLMFGRDNLGYGFLLYYIITDLVSIDFENTATGYPIWPSDGFDIEYHLNDFTNVTHEVYYAILHCDDTINRIDEILALNISRDKCLCNQLNQTGYICYSCHQHFDLERYLSLRDIEIDSLTFRLRHLDSDDVISPLIIPKQITMTMQRCIVFITVPTTVTTDDNPSISVSFSFSSNCYNRSDEPFSLNISGPSVNISKTFVIGVQNRAEITCTICDEHCYAINCTDNTLSITHQIKGINDGLFTIYFRSNMLDLKVVSTGNNTLHFYRNRYNNYIDKRLWFLLFLLLLIVPLIAMIHWFMKLYKNVFIVDKALVLIIGICQFESKKMFLGNVKTCVRNLKDLWRNIYNYEVFICNEDTLYCTHTEAIAFVDKYMVNVADKQAVIVHILSHGTPSSFTTSDGRELPIEFIKHELNTAAEDTGNESLIKLIFHQGCQGTADYTDESRIPAAEDMPIKSHENHSFWPCCPSFSNQIKGMSYAQKRNVFNIDSSIDNTQIHHISHVSNLIVVAGNVLGRTMSDSGAFTHCICQSFRHNLANTFKANLNTLMIDIGRNLEKITNGVEICTVSGNQRYNQIRFMKNKAEKPHSKAIQNEEDNVEMCYYLLEEDECI
eukprot:138419_1